MSERPKSGLEQLMQALMTGGVDMSGVGGVRPGQNSENASEADSDVQGQASASQPGAGQSPFTAFPGGANRGGGRGGSGGGGVQIPFVENIAEWGKKRLVAAVIILLIVLAAAYWWFHPAINIHSMDTWTFIFLIMFVIFVLFKAKQLSYTKGTAKVAKSEGKAKTFKVLSFLPIIVVALGLIGGIASMPIVPGNAARYASVLEIETNEFAEDIQEVNYSEIPVIDHETAMRLGNKEMGTIPEYVSQFEVSPLYSQINFHTVPTRVSPLGYADLFKWLTNRESGIPAYVTVDMTTQDAQVVSLPEGEGMKYSPSEPLARNIDRHVQLSYPFYMFDEKSFEIDEDGHPWWICPVQERTIGLFGGTTISRVVLCDAVTGECADYAVEECPQWVDRVYPADLLLTQYNWYGTYLNGWLNSFLGQSGVVQTTPGTDGLSGYNYIAKDDDVWVYTGVTSVTSDSSIIGFVLINQRTQEAHFYSVAGATETSAMASAEGQVQNLRYTATFPILINVANQPTYFMALKDGESLVKKFAMVDIQSYQIVAVGDTVAETQATYMRLLSDNGIDLSGAASPEDLSDALEAAGVIDVMEQVVLDGNSHYYITLEGDGVLFDFPISAIPEIVLYDSGDSIAFNYRDTGSPYMVESLQTE